MFDSPSRTATSLTAPLTLLFFAGFLSNFVSTLPNAPAHHAPGSSSSADAPAGGVRHGTNPPAPSVHPAFFGSARSFPFTPLLAK